MDESNVLDSGFLERMNTLLANGEVCVRERERERSLFMYMYMQMVFLPVFKFKL